MVDQATTDPKRRQLEERLRQVREELEAMALVPVEWRDYERWQKLALEEAELMKALRKGMCDES